jgi:predicted esterase
MVTLASHALLPVFYSCRFVSIRGSVEWFGAAFARRDFTSNSP